MWITSLAACQRGSSGRVRAVALPRLTQASGIGVARRVASPSQKQLAIMAAQMRSLPFASMALEHWLEAAPGDWR